MRNQKPPYLIPPENGQHPALKTPEILLAVLEYLVMPDVPTLMTDQFSCNDNGALSRLPQHWWRPLLVNHFWHDVGRQLVFRHVTLGPARTTTRAFASIYGSHQLQYDFTSSGSVHEDRDYLANMLYNLRIDLASSRSTGGFVLRACAYPFRELCLSNVTTMADAQEILSIRNVREGITLFKLSAASSHVQVPIHALLSASTNRPLSSDGMRDEACLWMPRLTHLLLHGATVAKLPPEWCDFLLPSLRLTTLRLCDIRIQVSHLHRLLNAVAGPSLHQVTLHKIASQGMTDGLIFTEADVLPASFLATWIPLCPNLQWLQIGEWSTQETYSVVTKLAKCIAPTPIQQIQAIQSCSANLLTQMVFSRQLTRLEIVGMQVDHAFLSRQVHSYLCSDQAIPLQELVLPGFEYQSKFFDPCTTLYPAPASGGRPRNTGVWACASLKLLVLSIHPFDYYVQPLFKEGHHAGYTRASRGVCGFIVASCPELQTLEIRFPKYPLDLDPDGGLCFLGRLQHLKHLVLRGASFERQGMVWPYDTPLSNVLIQKPRARNTEGSLHLRSPFSFSSSMRRTGSREGDKSVEHVDEWLPLPVLRWMSVEPTDDDRAKGWTNLARCRFLRQRDAGEISSGFVSLKTVVTKLTQSVVKSYYNNSAPKWTKKLEAILDDGYSAASEGSCWNQLQTFTCAADCINLDDVHRKRWVQTLVEQYGLALRKVLPSQVQVKVHWNEVDPLPWGGATSTWLPPLVTGSTHL